MASPLDTDEESRPLKYWLANLQAVSTLLSLPRYEIKHQLRGFSLCQAAQRFLKMRSSLASLVSLQEYSRLHLFHNKKHIVKHRHVEH